MNYYLFSAVHRCVPCKFLVHDLDKYFPEWKNYIEYVDVDNSTKEQMELALKLNIRTIPAFSNNETILLKGFTLKRTVEEIKNLCTKE